MRRTAPTASVLSFSSWAGVQVASVTALIRKRSRGAKPVTADRAAARAPQRGRPGGEELTAMRVALTPTDERSTLARRSWRHRTLHSARRLLADVGDQTLSVHDATAFRSERLPTAHFHRRFSDDNLAFWVPILVKAARIGPGVAVLDVGCGTGGFTRAIADSTDARVTGCDRAEKFIEAAKGLPPPSAGALDWVLGDAEDLPLPSSRFDRVLLSLVLHQLAQPGAAVNEAFRVLRAGGLVLVRTIAPGDAIERVPARYIPAMAAADAARLPAIERIVDWLEQAGFLDVAVECHRRNKRLGLDEQERELRTEVQHRYAFIADAEVEQAIERMRVDATKGEWIDPRPTQIIVAAKP
jgi:ubiquinone/menaquinone biosynthesis C-methylase UbiE